MSPITAITAELRTAQLSLKDESKTLRMLNAKGNSDRRQGHTGLRLAPTPHVLRRSVS
jgi:hypothetical protein